MCRDGDHACYAMARQISDEFRYQVNFDMGEEFACLDSVPGAPVHWSTFKLRGVYRALQLLRDFWGDKTFFAHFTPVAFRHVAFPTAWGGNPNTAAIFYHSDPLSGPCRALFPVGTSGGPVVELGRSTYTPWDDEENDWGWVISLDKQIPVIMHEMYHMFDWSVSGKPRSFHDPKWWMEQCRATLLGGSESHSIDFGVQADWNLFECYYAYSHGEFGLPPVIDSPVGEYAKAGPHEDFAETYNLATLYLLSGGKLCSSSGYDYESVRICMTSQTTTSDVGQRTDPTLDFARFGFFMNDCLAMSANVDTEASWP